MIKYVVYGHNGTIGNRVQAGFQINEYFIALSSNRNDAKCLLTSRRVISEHQFENMIK